MVTRSMLISLVSFIHDYSSIHLYTSLLTVHTPFTSYVGMMGYSYSQDDTRMCFNGPKSFQAGWYNTNYNGYATFTYSQAAQENTKLIGQVDYPSVNQDIVVIKIETGTSTDYFIHFNRAVDANSGTKEGANQVLITSAGNNGLSYAKSTLLVKLSAGGTYTLSLTEGDVEVTVNSIDTSASVGYADISISTGTESPTKSPSSSPTMTPTTKAPSKSPSSLPSASPTVSAAPSKSPTPFPTKAVSHLKICFVMTFHFHNSLIMIIFFYPLAHVTPYFCAYTIPNSL